MRAISDRFRSLRESREDLRVLAALSLSVCLHVLILLFADGLPQTTRPPGGNIIVTLDFPLGQRTGAHLDREAVLELPEIIDGRPMPSTDETKHHRQDTPPRLPPTPSESATLDGDDGQIVNLNQAGDKVLPPGVVRVVVVVDSDGKVKDIIWKELPVLSEEVLRSLEAELRRETYPSTGGDYPITKVIDVQSRPD